jgi:subtilisin family serine protease
MSLEYFSIAPRNFCATSSIRNVFASAIFALSAIALCMPAHAANPRKSLNGVTVDAKPKPTKHVAGQPLPDAHVLIQLSAPAAVESYANAIRAAGATTGSLSANVSASAAAATRTQIASNKAQQANLVSAMQTSGIKFQEIYRVQRVMNAVAVIVPAAQVAALSKLPGVKSVRPIVPMKPTSNSSQAFVNAPQVWQGTPAKADGTGVKIGIIDSGIDYQHGNFGGSGALADYQDNDRVSTIGINSGNTLFPTARVVGGWDFVGDAYDASGSTPAQTTPQPDPNPTDCGGHGSHVAGIAGGGGVTAGGSAFTGPYDSPVPTDLRIQPGMAPKSSLYALRIFGCGGVTDVVIAAIDWALDPNGDGDLSDHLDVINMSLGSEGGIYDLDDVIASDNAALSGMIVVASSGNSDDTYFITGAPALSPRTISVAASADAGELEFVLNVTAPVTIAGNYVAVPAAFGPTIPPAVVAGDLAYGTPANGCDAVAGTPQAIAGVNGKVALIDRGACTFQTKVYNAQLGGATGVVMVQNTSASPIIMSGDATVPAVNIASAMISQADGGIIKQQLANSVTVTGSLGSGPSLGDTMASFSSRGPVNDLPTIMKPDITAPGVNIVSTQTGMTCDTGGGCITPTAGGIDPDNQSLTISGTSMAAPQVAGLMALLRQLNPTATVEQLKAIAMNGSQHNLTTLPNGAGPTYGAARVGAGRIDAELSANLPVALYNADNSGTVSVTFPNQISASTSVTKRVRVTNMTPNPATYTLGFETTVDNPGISFSLPGGTSLSLLGHQTLDIDVTMSGSSNQLTNNFDPTISSTQATTIGTLPRYWMAEESAYLTLSTGGGTISRLPLYVAPIPVASMSGGTSVPTGGAGVGVVDIPLTGTGICTGTLTPGAGCAGNFPFDEVSLVSPFELQASNPQNPAAPANASLRNAGVSAFLDPNDPTNDYLNFGIAMWGPSANVASGVNMFVQVTLVDGSGNALFQIFPYVGVLSGTTSTFTNTYLTAVYDFAANQTGLYFFANGQDPSCCDTRIFQNDAFFMSAPFAAMGLTPTSTIHYYVDTFDAFGNFVDEVGPLTYHIGAPGLDFGGGTLLLDLPGFTIPVGFNVANLTANGSLGALLLHHHNAPGLTAQVLTVPPVVATPPILQGVVSRKVHGTAGTFDLPLPFVP